MKLCVFHQENQCINKSIHVGTMLQQLRQLTKYVCVLVSVFLSDHSGMRTNSLRVSMASQSTESPSRLSDGAEG